MWFTETPWPPFLIAITLALILFLRWSTQRRRGQLIGVGALLVASVVIVAVEALIVTDAERIEQSIYALAQAVETGNAEHVAAFFSNNNTADRDLVSGYVRLVEFQDKIRVSDLSTTMSSAGSRAISRFRASATVNFMGHTDRPRTRWELTWQREGNEWKIVRVQRLSFFRDAAISFTATD